MARRTGGSAIAGRALAGLALVVAAAAPPLRAESYLFFLEAQGIAGYSSAARKAIFYSHDQLEAMQKPSLGFDYVQRFAGARGDVAVLAIQGRLAINAEGKRTLEPQLYNAYLKLKLRPADVWIGHNKPAFGLAASFDSHGLLLQPLAMHGFGLDRDWGFGASRDFAWGGAGLSLTTGSGMPLALGKSYLAAVRIVKGVLERDNSSAGFSFGYGKLADYMGYEKLSDGLREFGLAALDLSWTSDAWENRVELLGGGLDKLGAFALSWRTGVGLLEEGRLKLEAQPAVILRGGKTSALLGVGATYLLHPDWTARAMIQHDTATGDTRLVVQIYFYKGLRF